MSPEIGARLTRVTHAQEFDTGNLYKKLAQVVSRKFLRRASRFPAQVFWYQILECDTAIMESIYGAGFWYVCHGPDASALLVNLHSSTSAQQH